MQIALTPIRMDAVRRMDQELPARGIVFAPKNRDSLDAIFFEGDEDPATLCRIRLILQANERDICLTIRDPLAESYRLSIAIVGRRVERAASVSCA